MRTPCLRPNRTRSVGLQAPRIDGEERAPRFSRSRVRIPCFALNPLTVSAVMAWFLVGRRCRSLHHNRERRSIRIGTGTGTCDLVILVLRIRRRCHDQLRLIRQGNCIHQGKKGLNACKDQPCDLVERPSNCGPLCRSLSLALARRFRTLNLRLMRLTRDQVGRTATASSASQPWASTSNIVPQPVARLSRSRMLLPSAVLPLLQTLTADWNACADFTNLSAARRWSPRTLLIATWR
jgi:hypothetical protein